MDVNFLGEWKIVLTGEEPESDITITFTDASDVFDKTIGVSDEFIQRILDLVKEKENYSIYTGIKKATSPSGEDKSDRALFMLVGEDKQGIKFALLLGQVDEKTWVITGFWPDTFAEACKSHNEILEAVLQTVLFDPDNWKFVEFVVPWAPFSQASEKKDASAG